MSRPLRLQRGDAAARTVAAASCRWIVIASALWATAAAASDPSQLRPAPGGDILPAAETAVATVVGRIHDMNRIDPHGWTAELSIERVLAGRAKLGAQQTIAWEELARSRPPRFRTNDRVLLALETLPGTSLWQERLRGRERGSVFAVAAGGNAFLRDPNARDLTLLKTYLALSPSSRAGATGVDALLEIIRTASPLLANEAIESLGKSPKLSETLDERLLRQALSSRLSPGPGSDRKTQEEDSRIALALIDMLGQRRIRGALPYLETLAHDGSPVEAAAVAAIAEIEGELDPSRARSWLDHDRPAVRAVAARHAPLGVVRERLPALLVEDESPAVRTAAALRLGTVETKWALEGLLAGLTDPAPEARIAVARAVGRRGDPIVPRLLGIVRDRDNLPAAEGAVIALSFAGTTHAAAALRDIAAHHSEERIRNLATIALGRLGGHEH